MSPQDGIDQIEEHAEMASEPSIALFFFSMLNMFYVALSQISHLQRLLLLSLLLLLLLSLLLRKHENIAHRRKGKKKRTG